MGRAYLMEVWRSILGWSYEVSDLGRVRNTRTGKVLKPYATRDGYLLVGLKQKLRRWQTTVHSLVMAIFVGPCPDGMEVNHVDGNKADCSRTNL